MRRPRTTRVLAFAAALPLFVVSAALPAQKRTFEGIITFRGEEGAVIQYYVGHSRVRAEVSSGDDRGVMIMDPAARTMYMLVPAQQMYMEMQLPAPDHAIEEHAPKMTVTKTGKTEVVAGHRCEYWHIVSSEDNSNTDVCLTTELGNFVLFNSPMRRSKEPAWERMFGKGDHFPLKVISHNGGKDKTEMEVTNVEPKSLDASLFSPPSSYRKMEMPMGAHH
ncbi:MAG: DUF4412 domain-containing protein [Gemmatimonadaceae bacterium]|nr:DUF4412 domain-containing protein [Gemmatimonadaceae bacterium]